MAFGSAMFVFAFLPACALVYRLVPGTRGKNCCLILASLLFYAFGRLSDLPILLGSVLVNFLAGLYLSRPRRGRRAVLAGAAALNLGLLVFYKYWNFLCAAFLPAAALPALPVPAGLSFFTFQGLSYVVDAYRDPARASRRFVPVLQYLVFFPNLISGPLQRFGDMRAQLEDRRMEPEEAAAGLRRFAAGLGKKLLLAAPLAAAADAAFALDTAALDVRAAWLGALCYTMQIFLDFSGYSDMAIGLAALFGFRLPENFRCPYLAGSVSDFWRRWHMTLSGWFRDYLYIPLGGNRRGRARTIGNKLAVFLATGLWHGANWTFVLWGLWHGLLVSLETLAPRRKERKGAARRCFGHVYTLLAVTVGFALFRAPTISRGWAVVSNLFGGFSLTAAATRMLAAALTRRTVFAFAAGCVIAAGLPARLWRAVQTRRGAALARDALALALLAACMLALAAGSFQPFIYQQF